MLEITKQDSRSSDKTIGELLREFREAVQRAHSEQPKEPKRKAEEDVTPAEKKDFSKSAKKHP
jgi:Sec-independent protein translocase protein TatA